jgi:signal peptidase I
MNRKLTALVFLPLIIGIGIGYGINYALYQPQLLELQSKLTNLISEISVEDSVEILRFTIVSSSMAPTLEGGDIVLVRKTTDPFQIKAAPYPDGDIIVFHKPDSLPTLILHRAIEKTEVNGTVYFRTKGDGTPGADYFAGDNTWNGMISEKLVVGKVIAVKPRSS